VFVEAARIRVRRRLPGRDRLRGAERGELKPSQLPRLGDGRDQREAAVLARDGHFDHDCAGGRRLAERRADRDNLALPIQRGLPGGRERLRDHQRLQLRGEQLADLSEPGRLGKLERGEGDLDRGVQHQSGAGRNTV
jgi:hypothetical protein